jgi:hypothetical protein
MGTTLEVGLKVFDQQAVAHLAKEGGMLFWTFYTIIDIKAIDNTGT